MEFFAKEIMKEQFRQYGKNHVSSIKHLMRLYTNKIMITRRTGETVIHFEYLIKYWCSTNVYILYYLKKSEIEKKNTFILSWNYHLNKLKHPIRNLNSDVMGVICSFLL
jgi:hypothetical protein